MADHHIALPLSLQLVIAVLLGGFFCCLGGAVRLKTKDTGPIKGPSTSVSETSSLLPPSSYQNSAPANYALPPTQKTVTYCVIDDRLVDNTR